MGMCLHNGGGCLLWNLIVPSSIILMPGTGRADGSVIRSRTIQAPRVGMITISSGFSRTGFVTTTAGSRPFPILGKITIFAPHSSTVLPYLLSSAKPLCMSGMRIILRIYIPQNQRLVPFDVRLLGDVFVVINKIHFVNILVIEVVSQLRGFKPDHAILGRVIAIVGLEFFRQPLDKIFAVPVTPHQHQWGSFGNNAGSCQQTARSG